MRCLDGLDCPPYPSYMQSDSAIALHRQENVEVMLANIDKTEVLENKSAELANQAKTFHKTARATKRHMCRQNAKMNLIIGCICLVILIAILIPILSYLPKGGGGPAPSPSPVLSPPPLPPPS